MKSILSAFNAVQSGESKRVDTSSTESMRDILSRFHLVESNLDAGQKKANQLSAEFKPKTVKVLGAKTDPKNPMAGKMVGGCEESLDLHEDDVAEDVLSKVKQGLADYLKSVADEIKDDGIKKKKKEDSDIKKKTKGDRDLIRKVKEDPAQNPSAVQSPSEPVTNPTYAVTSPTPVNTKPTNTPKSIAADAAPSNSAPVQSVTMEDGSVCEIHGDERRGFHIRRGSKSLRSRFQKLEQAIAAIHAYQSLRHKTAQHAMSDYISEQ